MKTHPKQRLMTFLAKCPGVTRLQKVVVTINAKQYQAVRYTQWGNDRIYCLGLLPTRRERVAYTFHSPFDWYVSGYYPPFVGKTQRPPDQRFEPYHPCGANFILAPWTAKEPIDALEVKPYQRIAIQVDQVTEFLPGRLKPDFVEPDQPQKPNKPNISQ